MPQDLPYLSPWGYLQVAYQWLNSDGAAMQGVIEFEERLPGEPCPAVEVTLRRTQTANVGPYVPEYPTGDLLPMFIENPIKNGPVIVESVLMLGATLWTRGISSGDSADGQELIDESWIEYSTDGETWVPVGAGPSVDVISLFDVESVYARSWLGEAGYEEYIYHYSAIETPQDVTLYFRLNIPAGVSTGGDFKANLELFVR